MCEREEQRMFLQTAMDARLRNFLTLTHHGHLKLQNAPLKNMDPKEGNINAARSVENIERPIHFTHTMVP